MLSTTQAQTAYRWLAAPLALATRYEAAANRVVLKHGEFDRAESVFEFGCGTGHFAAELLQNRLPSSSHYQGIDVTPAMIQRSQQQLAKFGDRAQVTLSDGSPLAEQAWVTDANGVDRFVSLFVLDLLPEPDIQATLTAAHRMLTNDGLLCLASLAEGQSALSRPAISVWKKIHRKAPMLVGGCRPLALTDYLPIEQWEITHHQVVEPLAIPLEVVVARKV